MKTTILALLIVCSSVIGFAQTTQEEYNYVTKGYKVQIESGLDMKKGYSLVDYLSQSTNERKVEFKGLFKAGASKPCAIMMIYTKTGRPTEYLCIPSPDASQDLWTAFWNSVIPDPSANNQDRLQLCTYALAKLSSQFAGK